MGNVTPDAPRQVWLAAAAGLVAGGALIVWWSRHPHPRLNSVDAVLDEFSQSLSAFRGLVRRAAAAADEGLALVDDVRRHLPDQR